MTRIVVDAMGSDNNPTPDVLGAVDAAREYGVGIILTGDASRIQPLLDSNHAATLPIRVVHAPETLTMNDKGEDLVMKARHKDAQNSMAVGYDLVKNGEADAFVTMGNTGAAMVTALFRLGRIRGVDRPALAGPIPTAEWNRDPSRSGRESRLQTGESHAIRHYGKRLLRARARREKCARGFGFKWRRSGQRVL